MSYLDNLHKAWKHAASMLARADRDGWSDEAKLEWKRNEATTRAELEAEQRRLMEPDAKLRW